MTNDNDNDIRLNNNNNNNVPLRIAIIGGGPAGMFFIHAMLQQMKKEQMKGRNVHMVCYEKSSQPGGIWRNDMNDTTIYEELWTNGPSSCCEFSDYTYKEHFGNDHKMTVYLSRNDLISYIMGRIKKHHTQSFFHDYFQYNTEVMNIKYVDQQFHCTIKQDNTNIQTVYYDKVIWACGENGKPNIPKEFQSLYYNQNQNQNKITTITTSLVDDDKKIISKSNSNSTVNSSHNTDTTTDIIDDLSDTDSSTASSSSSRDDAIVVRKQNVDNHHEISSNISSSINGLKIIHSSQTSTLHNDVHNKRVLIIGSGYSAEDMALQSIKFGVDHVYIISRSYDKAITWTSAWPYNKVTLYNGQEISNIIDNNTIQLRKVNASFQGYDNDKNDISNIISNIDTIILCTGYEPITHFIDESIRVNVTSTSGYSIKVPDNFHMKSALFSPYLEDNNNIPLSSNIKYLHNFIHPLLYNGILISNPNMMYVSTYSSEYPLLSIDVLCWLLSSYILGTVSTPNQTTMKQHNNNEMMNMLHNDYMRYHMDSNYYNAIHYNTKNFWIPIEKENNDNVVRNNNTNNVTTTYSNDDIECDELILTIHDDDESDNELIPHLARCSSRSSNSCSSDACDDDSSNSTNIDVKNNNSKTNIKDNNNKNKHIEVNVTHDYPDIWWDSYNEYSNYCTKKLAYIMEIANYPFSIGSSTTSTSDIDNNVDLIGNIILNNAGKDMQTFAWLCYYHRTEQQDEQQSMTIDNTNDDDANVVVAKTYRDYTNGNDFYSLHTGDRFINLSKPWLSM